MDLTVEAECFGSEIVFAENEVPNVVGRLVHDHASIVALPVPSIQSGRMPEYLKPTDWQQRISLTNLYSVDVSALSLWQDDCTICRK